MKKTLFYCVIILLLNSCAYMFNSKNSEIEIESEPSGANVFIDGKKYGQTPIKINIEAKNSVALLTKDGHGSAQLNLETWQAIKSSPPEDGKRCLADALGAIFVVPLFSFWSSYCREFKQSIYFVNIPYSVDSSGRNAANSRMQMSPTQQPYLNNSPYQNYYPYQNY